MLYSNDLAQQGGITTTTEMTFGILDIDLEKKLMEKFTSSDVTSLRISPVAYADSFSQKYGDQAMAQVQDLRKLNTDRLFYKGIKKKNLFKSFLLPFFKSEETARLFSPQWKKE